MTNPHPVYRPDIDGLRATAVLSIVVFHAFPTALPGGFVGVDVFFVISGYLITSILLRGLENNSLNLAEFYARRIRRIFPALAVVLATCLVIGWWILLPDEYMALGQHTAAGAGFVSNFLLWQEAGYFDTASELKPLLHLWSLSIEEQFYLLWPALLLLANRMRIPLWATFSALITASLLTNLYLVDKNVVATFFMPITRGWELLAGGGLAYLQSRSTPVSDSLRQWAAGLGLALIVGACFLLDPAKLFPGAWALLPTLGAVLLIAAGPSAWLNRILLARRWMVAIGLVSYPLYLWHWPLLSFARIMESGTPSPAIRFGALSLALLLAGLTYLLIERPLRFSPRPAVVGWLAGILLALACAGLLIHWQDGVAARTRTFAAQNDAFEWESKGLLTRDDCSKQLNVPARCLHNRTPYSIAILGDSHSTNTFFALSHAFRNTDAGIVRLGRAGCLPFYDLESTPAGVPEGCREAIGRHLDYVLGNPGIHTVVLSTRGPLYTEAIQPSGHRHYLNYVPRPELDSNLARFEHAMAATLTRIEAAGKRVIFVMDWPELGFDPRSCVDSRPVRLSSSVRSPCAVARPGAETPSGRYQHMVRRVLARFPRAWLWETPDYFCDSQYCWGMKDDAMLYRDSDHLSLAGSRYLGEHFPQEWVVAMSNPLNRR